jgi:hypothetical protein
VHFCKEIPRAARQRPQTQNHSGETSSTLFAFLFHETNFQDIVDTEPFEPELTGNRLAKALLGGINRKLDEDKKNSRSN